MNSSLRKRIQSKIDHLIENHLSMIDEKNLKNTEWLLNYVEANVTCFNNIQENIGKNLKRKISNKEMAKNSNISLANKYEIKYYCDEQLERILNTNEFYSHEDNGKYICIISKKILKLANKALRYCDFNDKKLMANLFYIRTKQLIILYDYDAKDDKENQSTIRDALINIDLALSFRMCRKYILTKLVLMVKMNQIDEAIRLFRLLLGNSKLPMTVDELKHFLKSNEDYDDNEIFPQSFFEYRDDHSIYKDDFNIDQRCTLVYRNGQGRFFIANDNIESNRLIFQEKSYSLAMFADASLVRCQYCYSPVENTFIPCENCSEIVYCSKKCSKLSKDSHHQLECRMNKFWIERSKSTYHMFKLLNRFKIDNVLKIKSNDKRIEDHINDLIQKNQTTIDSDSKTELFMNLINNFDKQGFQTISYNLTNAIDVAISATIVQNVKLSRQQIISLIGFCMQGILRISMNSFQWSNIGSCLCLIASFFNHRCNHNAEWKFENGNFNLTTIRPIAAFEEISINYGCGWPLLSYKNRLRQHSCYHFQCNCIECMEDCKTILALQCKHCSIGPVLLSSIVYDVENNNQDATCMLCYHPYKDTKIAYYRLKYLRNKIEIITEIFGCLASKMRSTYLTKLVKHLDESISLMYNRSKLLANDIQRCCQIFVEFQDNCTWIDNDLIFKYAALIDDILPRYDQDLDKIKSLDMIRQQDNIDGITRYLFNHYDDNFDATLIDNEIKSISFWTNYFRHYFRQQNDLDSSSSSSSKQIMKMCSNFNNRLFGLIKFRIELLLTAKQSDSNDEEIKLLNELLKSKQRQWNILSKRFDI